MEDKLDKLIEYHQGQYTRFRYIEQNEQAAWHSGAVMGFSTAKDMLRTPEDVGPCDHEWEPCNAVQCENCGLIVED